jgi:serine acetyltransferase
MPNVRIEENSIIAAGSIVTKDVKAGTVVGGNPAKVIGDFDTVMKKRALESENTQDVNRLLRVDSEWEKFRKQRQ